MASLWMVKDIEKVDSLEKEFIFGLHLTLAILAPLLVIVVLLTDVPNEIPSLILLFVIFSFAVSGLYFEKHRHILANAVLTITLPFYVLIVFQNGLAAAVLAPLVGLFYFATQNRVLMIAGTLVAVFCPLALSFTQSHIDIAILSRIAVCSLFSAILVYSLTQKANRLFSTILENAETNARMYSIAGHELRTPAALINMLADVELEKYDSKNTLEIKKLSTQLLDVLDDMKISRLGNEVVKQRMRFEAASVFETVKRAVNGVKPMANRFNIQIKLNDERQLIKAHKTPTKIVYQVVQNLVKNAILHSGGTTVEVAFIEEALENQKTKFHVSVVDDGQGISKAFQAKMFDAFARGDSKSDGTGLGLNVCKQLASGLEGGELIFRDNPPHGASFEFSFVLEQVDAETDLDSNINALSGLKILLVDDSNMLRMLGRKLLEKNGAVVTDVCDGFEALEVLGQCNPDVVVTDIMMPNCDGYELTSELRKNGFEKPIFGVTGSTMGQEKDKLVKYGATAVLSKPLTFNSLNEALLRHQNNHVQKR